MYCSAVHCRTLHYRAVQFSFFIPKDLKQVWYQGNPINYDDDVEIDDNDKKMMTMTMMMMIIMMVMVFFLLHKVFFVGI